MEKKPLEVTSCASSKGLRQHVFACHDSSRSHLFLCQLVPSTAQVSPASPHCSQPIGLALCPSPPLSLQTTYTAGERVPGEGTVAGSDVVEVGEELSYLQWTSPARLYPQTPWSSPFLHSAPRDPRAACPTCALFSVRHSMLSIPAESRGCSLQVPFTAGTNIKLSWRGSFRY